MILSTLSPTAIPGPVDLPCEFNYKPYIPAKRITTKQTNKGTYTQKMVPLVLHGLGFVDWEIKITTSGVAKQFLDWYNLDDTFTFTGAYDEVYLIEFTEFKFPKRTGGYPTISGKFRVICEINPLDPNFQCV